VRLCDSHRERSTQLDGSIALILKEVVRSSKMKLQGIITNETTVLLDTVLR
jgi:hypothetical protein